ncbi:hypothetical protein [Actinomadura rudentiformis]|uniref:Uncharacterized protein n=1 Tax=Actinomadura rudentiformis TaxID=359158 RepID=A0A6H9YII3_9ACTN|nr:hypothetical protein [Actinomadura rudentiformis]KAB2346464.1 hypothetical protein F8566_23690 [Actinomadura rudentiformis]
MYNTISLIALALSGFTTLRQLRHAHSSSDMTMLLEVAMRNIRDKDFQSDQHYVLTRLAQEHSPDGGMDASRSPFVPRRATSRSPTSTSASCTPWEWSTGA